jgi:hypothetical protein
LFDKTGIFFYPISQAICFKKPVESLNSCQTAVRQNRSFFHPILQGICFKKPVEGLNSCQTIVRQKRRIFPFMCTGIEETIFKNIDCGIKQSVKLLTATIKNFV